MQQREAMRLATCCYGSCALVLFLQLVLLWVGMHASPKFREAVTAHRSGGRRAPPHTWTPGVHDESIIIEPAPDPEVLQAQKAPHTTARRTHTRSEVPEELRRAPENYVELPKDDKNMLKFLRMCEAARGGPQDGRQIQCDQDPTCVQCIPEYKMRGAQKLLRAYTNATLAERRVEYIRTSFPLDADVPVRQREAVIVISSNTRGIHLILNWACGCERKGMADVRDHTLVLATDDAAHEYAARAGFHSLHPELFGHAMDEDDPSLPNPEKIGGFNSAMGSLWIVLSEMLKNGYNVIAQDADIVWLRDPRPAFSHSHVDIRSQMAPSPGTRGPANTGFVVIQANEKTARFAHAMVHTVPIMYWRSCDQLAFNTLLRHYRFRQLHYECLQRRQVLDLHIEDDGGGTRGMISNVTYLLHAVGASKESKMRMVGEWHFDSRCRYYDEALLKNTPTGFREELAAAGLGWGGK